MEEEEGREGLVEEEGREGLVMSWVESTVIISSCFLSRQRPATIS